MDAKIFKNYLEKLGTDFYTGVPDSLLMPFCDLLVSEHGTGGKHIIAANEGGAVGLAAGHYLASGKPAAVYMQNSGIGNAVNPVCSLLHENVYAIPAIFVIGWRGRPGEKDEPQHVYQGKSTLAFMDALELPYIIITPETTEKELAEGSAEFAEILQRGRSVAFIVEKGGLTNNNKNKYSSSNIMTREEIVEIIIENAPENSIFVSTTGKLSRELFELREKKKSGHQRDFLTVGSMGHSIMIAYAVALEKPSRPVYCLDGDGAVLMHAGSLAVAGAKPLDNLTHITINNGAHETVGGLPTAAADLRLCDIAKSAGYPAAYRAENKNELLQALENAKGRGKMAFIEALANLESRADLGRPTTTPIENKRALMNYISK